MDKLVSLCALADHLLAKQCSLAGQHVNNSATPILIQIKQDAYHEDIKLDLAGWCL